MILDPFDAAQKFVTGLIAERHLQGWFRLGASLIATAFVSFFGTFGISLLGQVQANIPAGVALPIAIGHASLTMALMVLGIWLRSPLTKGIPILYPGKIEAERLKQLAGDGTVFDPNEKR